MTQIFKPSGMVSCMEIIRGAESGTAAWLSFCLASFPSFEKASCRAGRNASKITVFLPFWEPRRKSNDPAAPWQAKWMWYMPEFVEMLCADLFVVVRLAIGSLVLSADLFLDMASVRIFSRTTFVSWPSSTPLAM